MCVHVCVCTSICTCVYVCLLACVCMCVCLRVCVSVCVHGSSVVQRLKHLDVDLESTTSNPNIVGRETVEDFNFY